MARYNVYGAYWPAPSGHAGRQVKTDMPSNEGMFIQEGRDVRIQAGRTLRSGLTPVVR